MKFGVLRGVLRLLVGTGDVFPFVLGGQSFPLPFGISFGGEPGHVDDGSIDHIRARLKIALPVLEISVVGEDSFDFRPLPLRIIPYEIEEVRVRDRVSVDQEVVDLDSGAHLAHLIEG